MNKTPKLRFKEFSGDWESKKLGDLTTLIQSGLSRQLSDKDIGVPVIRSNNLINGKIDTSDIKYWYSIDTQGAKLENYFLKKNDLLVNFINSLAQIGKCSLYNNELNRNTIFTTNIMRLNFSNNVDVNYIHNYFNLKKYSDYIQSIAKPAVNQASFTVVDFKRFKINIPSLEEQEKIASFFSLIDKKISLQSEKLEMLKEYKTGMMQKIFSRELRFKDDSGRDYPEWEEKKLGNYIVEYKEKTTKNNQYPPLTSSRRGLFLQSDYFDKQIASSDNTGYNIVPRNYFTYRHMSDDAMFYFNINNLVDYGIVSTLYPVFATSKHLNSLFLKYYLNETNEFKRYSLLQKQGGSRTYMYLSKLKEFKIKLPNIEEQDKIVKFLLSIDNKVDKEQEKLDSLNEYKKGLLQQMFV